ncbi:MULTISPECIES: HAD family hydrolase [Pseudidiomarina]|uniref:Phosphoglycolate phosphatase n=2 Tax=Pseudidiomarina TaxID=2800384 RepID=A0A368V3T8_9GAMM|nr:MULTISPECIES: HAD-IA family hydrolase [Pseudidiomarina]PWW15041.1 phosphoglycolate phosphatase [Pseudidiomarina maritima]RBP91585.1 phosphoglycolate phosphatase [Pseudidiomarina tainanensis]RCW35015.1 phosphoglycolate phosphatase [Pseudidiomarina tainanensis]
MSRPAAILFDLDGTLLDTAPDLGAALNRVLKAEQRPLVSASDYTPIASHGSAGLLRFAYGEAEFEQRKDELRHKFLSFYSEAIAEQTQLFAGVSELLAQLQQQQIPVAIVTNKPTALTVQLLPSFPELAAIEVVVCGDTLAVAKPSPQPLLHATQALQVVAGDCWYVGDAERDIQAGRAAGMRTIVANYGYISAIETPTAWGADSFIETPLELLDLLT